MQILIEIDSTHVREREIDTAKGSFTARDQTGWLQLPGKRYPQEVVVSLDAGQTPYPEGSYRVLEDSVTVDRFKRPIFQRVLQLEPIENDKIKELETG